MSQRVKPTNPRDEHGHPICPVCKHPIKPGTSAVLADDQVVHLECADRSRGERPAKSA